MPRSEVWKGDGARIDGARIDEGAVREMSDSDSDGEWEMAQRENKVICTDENHLESGQRYGLMEDERSISGQKRICFCYGYMLKWCEYKFLPYCLVLMYPIMFLMGFYSGLDSNCVYNQSDT